MFDFLVNVPCSFLLPSIEAQVLRQIEQEAGVVTLRSTGVRRRLGLPLMTRVPSNHVRWFIPSVDLYFHQNDALPFATLLMSPVAVGR